MAETRRKSRPKNALQQEGAKILNAQLAAERLLERGTTERRAVMSLSRDEVLTLARQMLEVSSIAEKHHLARATVGALPPDAFAGPVE